MITTLCRDCIFADYANLTQYGCELNRLELFKKNGAELTLKEEDGLIYYSINRLCNTCRNRDWAKKNYHDRVEKVYKEIELQCDVILFAEQLEELEYSLKSIAGSYLLPSCVLVILDKKEIKPLQIVKLLENIPYNWQVIQSVEDKIDSEKVEEAVGKGPGDWYCLLECGKELPETLLKEINTDINQKLERYVTIQHEDFQVYSKAAHRALNGFYYSKLYEEDSAYHLYKKIQYFADKNNTPSMIKHLCSTISQ